MYKLVVSVLWVSNELDWIKVARKLCKAVRSRGYTRWHAGLRIVDTECLRGIAGDCIGFTVNVVSQINTARLKDPVEATVAANERGLGKMDERLSASCSCESGIDRAFLDC